MSARQDMVTTDHVDAEVVQVVGVDADEAGAKLRGVHLNERLHAERGCAYA